jgi:hypothetical protein
LQKYQFQQELIQAQILHIGMFLLHPEQLAQRDQLALLEDKAQQAQQELLEAMERLVLQVLLEHKAALELQAFKVTKAPQVLRE